ncbi:MAG: ATP-dependent DNA helicase RecG, partial [Pseudomonadota bacterium]
MDTLPFIINSIKSPLLFISRTNFKKIEAVKDLEGTISQLTDRALTCNVNEIQRELFLGLKNSFANFSLLEETIKIRIIQEALTILQRIENETPAFHDDIKGYENTPPFAKGGLGGFSDSKPSPKEAEEISALIAERNKILSTPIQYIKGVGPRIASLLKKKGIETVEDALYFIPRDYEDRRNIKPIAKAEVGQKETLRGTILGMSLVSYNRRKVFEMIVGDKSGSIIAKWFNFNQPYLTYLKKRFKTGQEVIISGKVEAYRFQREISHPDIEIIDEEEKQDSLHFKRIVPKYSETEGLHQKTIRRIMKNVVDGYAHSIPDGIPRDICQRRTLVDMSLALRRVHFPENDDHVELLISERSPYHRRIIFDEFFFLELRLALRKKGIHLEKGIVFQVGDDFLRKFEELLPFSLASAQKRVIHEIQADMAKPYPMNRLLQGDVGSGKTVVALAAALMAVENHCQVALMAPTELLAEQHYFNIHQLAEKIGLRTAFLSSSTKKSARSDLYENVKNGKIDLIIGTHAIIQESVEFSNLGLGIIDEQHRFGVIQRAALKKKGGNPHILVMTATPIPRTLSMTVYGDLDI